MVCIKLLTLAIFGFSGLVGGKMLFAQEPQIVKAHPFQWQTATPESQGMSSERLDALREKLVRMRTSALLVIRNDKIVYEYYAADTNAHKPLGTASLAKALVGGMSLAFAINDGKISLDDLAMKYIPAWRNDPMKSKITIRQLGSHTSGISDASVPGVKHEDLKSWMGDFWNKLDPPNDPFSIARDKAPVMFEPGQKIKYSNPGIAMLTYCVAASLQGSPQNDVRTLLRDRMLRPIGIPDNEWSLGYQKVFQVDGLPLIGAWGGAAFSADAQARIGRLILRQGDWDGQRILTPDAVRLVTTDAGLPGHCGMGWWANGGRYSKLPQDAVWGAGAGDRVLLVIPSLQLIVVRSGQSLLTPAEVEQLKPNDVFEEYHDPRERVFFRPLIETINR